MTRKCLICIALLAGCAVPTHTSTAPTVTAPEGGVWSRNSDGSWIDQLGRETNRDPRIPLCSEVTLKKDARECVVRR